MKKSIKGSLLSGLVFPGLGQIVLKSYPKGIAIMLAVLAGVAIIVMEAVQTANSILQELESEGAPININTITDAANKASETGGALSGWAFLLIVICWIYGIVDAFYTGKKLDGQ